MSIIKRERIQSLIVIETIGEAYVFSLRDWNLNFIKAKPLFKGNLAECKEFAKYHEAIW